MRRHVILIPAQVSLYRQAYHYTEDNDLWTSFNIYTLMTSQPLLPRWQSLVSGSGANLVGAAKHVGEGQGAEFQSSSIEKGTEENVQQM